MNSSPHQDQGACEDVLFSFGAISDVQCGDLEDRSIPDLPNRYYRGALSHLGDAIDFWNRRAPAPSFALQLGDVIDGFNITHGGREQSRDVLAKVLKECSAFKGDFHHVWGNHEFYNFTRLELLNSPLFSGLKYLKHCHPSIHKQSLSRNASVKAKSNHFPSQTQPLQQLTDYDFIDETIPAYYDFCPYTGFRFILLDTFEVSSISYTNEDSQERTEAINILRTHNKNKQLNDFSGLEGKERRFVSYNGSVSNKQLDWLKNVLDRAKKHKEKVVVFGHVPICREVSLDDCLVWNYQDVLALLQSSRCVIATLFGHTHQYRHHIDEGGIHHFVLPGIVECEPGMNGYMTFDMCKGKMIVHRAGDISPLILDYSQAIWAEK